MKKKAVSHRPSDTKARHHAKQQNKHGREPAADSAVPQPSDSGSAQGPLADAPAQAHVSGDMPEHECGIRAEAAVVSEDGAVQADNVASDLSGAPKADSADSAPAAGADESDSRSGDAADEKCETARPLAETAACGAAAPSAAPASDTGAEQSGTAADDATGSADSAAAGRSRGRFLKRMMALLTVMLLMFSGVAGWLVYHYAYLPPEEPGKIVEVVITPGMAFVPLARELEQKGVVRSADALCLLAKFHQAYGKLRTGRFEFSTGWTLPEVLNHLLSGKPRLDRVTIPEGLSIWNTAKRLEEAGFVKAEDFLAVVRDPDFLKKHGIPFDSAEGFLFPDTYVLMRPVEVNAAAARDMAELMVDTFWRRCSHLLPEDVRNNEEQLRYIVTLASIVEKETSVPKERARVAGVYANRLKRGMLLQADPTVIYGLGPSFAGALKRSHLADEDNPYNTYRHPGLPPGPICSFGLPCLEAAVSPEPHTFLFFVATGNGDSHVFSTTFQEHTRAVQAYRAARRAAKN